MLYSSIVTYILWALTFRFASHPDTNCCNLQVIQSNPKMIFHCLDAFDTLAKLIIGCRKISTFHFPCSDVFVLYNSIDKCHDIWLGHCLEKHYPWFCYGSSWVWGAEWTSLVHTWQHIRPGEWFLQKRLVSEVLFRLSYCTIFCIIRCVFILRQSKFMRVPPG